MADGWDEYPHDWDERRRAVYQRDECQCQNCGRRGGVAGDAELHCHHIVPKSKGGSHHKSNLATLCRDCHNQVHDHHIPKMSNVSSGSRSQNAGLDDWQSSTQASESLQAVANKHFESNTESLEESIPTKESSKPSSTVSSGSYDRMPKRTGWGSLGWIIYALISYLIFLTNLGKQPDLPTLPLESLVFVLGISIVLIQTSYNKMETVSVALLVVPVCFLLAFFSAVVFPNSSLINGSTDWLSLIWGFYSSRLETSDTSYYDKIQEYSSIIGEMNNTN